MYNVHIYRPVLLPPPLWYLDLWGIIVCGGFANYYAPGVCVYTGQALPKTSACVLLLLLLLLFLRNNGPEIPATQKQYEKPLSYIVVNAA